MNENGVKRGFNRDSRDELQPMSTWGILRSMRHQPPAFVTVAGLLRGVGGIDPARVLCSPAPGTATPKDVARLLDAADKRLCELFHGVLVEKPRVFRDSILTAWLASVIINFFVKTDLGVVCGPDGAFRLSNGKVLIPDVSFLSWELFPDRTIPETAIPKLAPTIAIEVLSKSNTKGEMALKRQIYCAAGSKQVWEVDPKKKTVQIYTDAESMTKLTINDTLDGGDILPGFQLPLKQLFNR
jgi:Uma2 family endonuclease